MADFYFTFEEDNQFESSVLDEVVLVGGEELPSYKGNIDIVPKSRENVILETANTRVLENITVRPIPYFETGNESGITVYIGGEI